MKLSKSAWNNVIIFSILTMILVINMMENNANDSEEDTDNYLLTANAVILTLAVEDIIKIERVGKSWRATPNSVTGQALEQMMLAWQQSEGSGLNVAPTVSAAPLIVTAELAGVTEQVVLHVYRANDQLLVHNQLRDLWLVFPNAISQQVLPVDIFN